ncbi:MAG: DNRLRE domain-containing protein [Planctomycetes bacterium]|nr:DNRLRE domain-containing protein [Planctomycetota bacterium]
MASSTAVPLRSLIAALAMTAADLTAQTTVSVPCVLDNTLYQSATGTLSNGRGTGLYVGVTGQPGIRRPLLKFDVDGVVPAGARILSAQLNLSCVTSAFGGPLPVTMHRALASWGEGTSVATGGGGQGAAARTGDATWLHRFYPNTFWTSPGGDFAPTPSATIVTPPYGLCSSNVTTALVADVQSMLDNPSGNFGWLLKTNELTAYMARKIESRESNFTKPVLSVTYVLPGQSASLGVGCPVNGQPFTYALSGAPLGGTTVQLVPSNGPANQSCANLIGLSFELPGTPLLPQCNLLLPLGGVFVLHSITTLDGAGTASSPLALPTGYTGVSLVLQAAALDNSPAGYVLSNAVFALLQ